MGSGIVAGAIKETTCRQTPHEDMERDWAGQVTVAIVAIVAIVTGGKDCHPSAHLPLNTRTFFALR
ncbi:MAG: hypothetical protein KBD39_00400 [Sterolibacterium sp.]|nr:hypothetical protein [Sterolibacterium sp.]MBP9798572.1 hypothetical protein [Sterolibacterium sp.]